MSPGTADLIKVLVVTAATFAVATLVMLYGISLLSRFGSDLPVLGSLASNAPPGLVPLLADGSLFATLAAVHVTATGLALVLTSQTIDMALLITSKAAAVVITALLGYVGGHMVFLQLTEQAQPSLPPLAPAVIALAGFLVLSTVLSATNLRRFGAMRFLAALALIVLGPLLLLWL